MVAACMCRVLELAVRSGDVIASLDAITAAFATKKAVDAAEGPLLNDVSARMNAACAASLPLLA
jgi:hypothetical protein